MNVQNEQVLEKLASKIDDFIDDGKSSSKISLCKMFTEILPHIPNEFRDKIIIPRILLLTQKCQNSTSHQSELASALFENYQSLISHDLDELTVKQSLLPGMKILSHLKFKNSEYETILKTLIQDLENASVKNKAPPATPEKKNLFPSFFAFKKDE